jgi:hypothetical protein
MSPEAEFELRSVGGRIALLAGRAPGAEGRESNREGDGAPLRPCHGRVHRGAARASHAVTPPARRVSRDVPLRRGFPMALSGLLCGDGKTPTRTRFAFLLPRLLWWLRRRRPPSSRPGPEYSAGSLAVFCCGGLLRRLRWRASLQKEFAAHVRGGGAADAAGLRERHQGRLHERLGIDDRLGRVHDLQPALVERRTDVA